VHIDSDLYRGADSRRVTGANSLCSKSAEQRNQNVHKKLVLVRLHRQNSRYYTAREQCRWTEVQHSGGLHTLTYVAPIYVAPIYDVTLLCLVKTQQNWNNNVFLGTLHYNVDCMLSQRLTWIRQTSSTSLTIHSQLEGAVQHLQHMVNQCNQVPMELSRPRP